MSVTKQQIISFLAKRYSGDVPTRGLWLWAEGNSKDIPYLYSSEDHWTELWALAENEETRIQPMNLIQEALMDDPGNDFLIKSLISLSKSTGEAIKNNARLIVEIWEHWSFKLDLDSMKAALLIFIDCPVREGATILIPVLNDKIDEKLCDKWEPWFQKIKKEERVSALKGIFGLMDLMLDAMMLNNPRIDSAEFHFTAPKVKTYFEKKLKGFEDLDEKVKVQDLKIDLEEFLKISPNDQLLLESLIVELIPLTSSFLQINPKILQPNSNTALMGIQRLFELCKIITYEKKWPKMADSAEICFKSIWATKAKKTKYETAKTS
jgi:hypothetical protein